MRYQSFSFGGRDLGALADVSAVLRSVAPGRRVSETEIPGYDGEIASASGLKPLTVKVTASLKARTVEGVSKARRDLAEILLSSDTGKLVLPDEPGVYLVAMYMGGAELSRNSKRPTVELEFLCPDPVAYGAARTATVTGSQSVAVGGNYPSWPVVEAVPEASPWRVTNAFTGEFVEVRASFDGKKKLRVDMAAGTCSVDGASWPVTLDSDYFRFGGSGHDQVIKVSAGSATLSWRERWA